VITSKHNGFSLIELMVSMAILLFIMLIFTAVLNSVSATWTAGDQRASTFQDGRAILDLIGRELTSAAMSPNLQFVATSNISNTRANSDSIFWQAPLTYRLAGSATPITNVCEVGYYIDTTSSYNLKRFFVQPGDTTNFQIYSGTPSYNSATWVTSYFTKSGLSNVIASGVVALWVRCFDTNGDLIPWTSTASHHYNSAQSFQPATLGSSNSFTYTSNTNTAGGNLLPNAVELTIVLIDDKTLQKVKAIPTMIPAMSTVASPAAVSAALTAFNNSLIANKVSTARTFTSRVVIPNSVRQ
jgi:prepilin-type N-terminal cleavage/methylation domain-containing protein